MAAGAQHSTSSPCTWRGDVEKRTLEHDVKPRAGSCRGAPVRARPDLPPRGWKGSPPPGRRAVATQKKSSRLSADPHMIFMSNKCQTLMSNGLILMELLITPACWT